MLISQPNELFFCILGSKQKAPNGYGYDVLCLGVGFKNKQMWRMRMPSTKDTLSSIFSADLFFLGLGEEVGTISFIQTWDFLEK